MKKLLILPLLLLSIGILSCKKETVPDQQAFMQQKNMSIINPGLFVFGTCDNWYISLLQIDRSDLTDNYKSVNLIFCPGNTVVVFNDILAVSGNWYVTLDKGNPITLVIDLHYPAMVTTVDRHADLWRELAGEWKINKLQKNIISLQADEQVKKMILERGSLY